MQNPYLPPFISVNKSYYRVRKNNKHLGNFSSAKDAIEFLFSQPWYSPFKSPKENTIVSDVLNVLLASPGEYIILKDRLPQHNLTKYSVRSAVVQLRDKYNYDIDGKQRTGAYCLYGHRRTKDGSYVDLTTG